MVKLIEVLIALLVVRLPSPINIITSSDRCYCWYSGKKPLLATRSSSSEDIQRVNWSAACCSRYAPRHDHCYWRRLNRSATVHARWGQFSVSFVKLPDTSFSADITLSLPLLCLVVFFDHCV